MSEIYITDSNGETKSLRIDPSLNLMEHLRDADYDEVQALCGGGCSCATCHVHIVKSAGKLSPVEENEELLLEMTDDYDAEKSRLSCQIDLDESHAGLQVTLLNEGF